MKTFILAAAAVTAAAAWAASRQAAPDAPSDNSGTNLIPDWGGASTAQDATAAAETDPTHDYTDLLNSMDPRNLLPLSVAPDLAAANVRAFLTTIAVSEDTEPYGDHGYNVLFGHGLFTSYADHPRRYFSFTNRAGETLRTSAAGRSQFIVPTWDRCAAALHLPDFSPASQDLATIYLIREKGALRDVQEGRFSLAVDKVRRVWASFPASGNLQGERSIQFLASAYTGAGGSILEG